MITTSEIPPTQIYDVIDDVIDPVIGELQTLAPWFGGMCLCLFILVFITRVFSSPARKSVIGSARMPIENDNRPSARFCTRNARRLRLQRQLKRLNEQIDNTGSLKWDRPVSDREHLISKRGLVVAELDHIKSVHSQVDPHIFDGLSRGALSSERRKRVIRIRELLEDFSNRLVKPGPLFRTELFTNNDELEAIDEAQMRRQGYSLPAAASTPESGNSLSGENVRQVFDFHERLCDRWAEWHTDLGLLTEFPAIHDVQHEEFARRIIDAYDSAKSARTIAETNRGTVTAFSDAVKEFEAALDDGEHKARLIARGPALDPVLARIMTNAETLLTKIRDYQAGNAAVSWGECQVAAEGLTKLLKPVIGHQADAIPELESTIARELEAART